METAFWQKLDTNNFNVFIRDLSISVNTNLKFMIEDLDNVDKALIVSDKTSMNKNKKKKIIKKKDIIIKEQNEKRYKRFLEEDSKTCEFLLKNINDKNPYLNFDKLKTDEGKLEYKLKLLERYWSKKKKYISHVFILYYHLKKYENKLTEERTKIMKKIESILQEYDCKLFMLNNLGHLLPPLNSWDKGLVKLDPWQERVIQMIRKNESVIVRAPTSSGKTFIAMAAGIMNNKILYICPAKPVAYQVGANYIKMGYNVHYLIEGHAHLSFNDKTNIYIGTPETIERYIYKIGTHFNYAVYDEIHNLNEQYENIIKLLDCNFIALSATIKNSQYLVDKFNFLYPSKTIQYVEYTKRFINQQRWFFTNNKLAKLHPIICLDPTDFEGFGEISFTPNDCARLYERMVEEFENTEIEDKIDKLSPDNYFKEDKLLTLDDSKEYEIILKEELKTINISYPKEIQNIINSFDKKVKDNDDQFFTLFQKCKANDLLPMIVFHTEQEITKEIFMNIDKELYENEKLEYPFHYDILKKKKELYESYIEKRKIYSDTIKIKTKSKDPINEKLQLMNDYDSTEKNKYISIVIQYYNSCISKCSETENESNKIKNLNKELIEFINHPDFGLVDEFKKHKDFCFTSSEPMSGTEIRTIRRQIKKTTGKVIDYEDPLFQLLKRGIGLYITSMPEEYNWIVQKLMSEKKLGIVISDKTLCMGIDLPIRSVCFTGYKNPNFSKEDYLQMGGRAGRRGHDTSGNIIFHNISNYKELMKGELPDLLFEDKELNPSYRSLQLLNPRIQLNKLSIAVEDINCNPKMNKLLWYLKDYDKSLSFVERLHKYEKTLFLTSERDREYALFSHILENLFDIKNETILIQFKQNKIEDKYTREIIIKIGSVCKDIINSLHPVSYKIIVENSLTIFDKITTINYFD